MAEVSGGKYCEDNNKKDSYFISNKALEIYKRCDLQIANCQKCSSETKCDSCSDGYKLQENDGISMCYNEKNNNNNNEEEDDDDGLSKGAIASIILGCIGCAALIFFIILLFKRKKDEKEKEKEKQNTEKKIVETAKEEGKDPLEDDIKVIEFDKKSEIMDVTAKRMASKDKSIY